ncbi:hypothetical protein [Streptomyces californicus]|uniref:hypothetical protein n=1 Tax=Streptomyces californicus TaxID=67351 RepID=UPI00381A1180
MSSMETNTAAPGVDEVLALVEQRDVQAIVRFGLRRGDAVAYEGGVLAVRATTARRRHLPMAGMTPEPPRTDVGEWSFGQSAAAARATSMASRWASLASHAALQGPAPQPHILQGQDRRQ